MAITEKEARQRLCPAAGMRDRCVTTNCMAWQFVPKEIYRKTELWSKSKNQKVNTAFSDDGEWRPIAGETTELPADVGCCTFLTRNQFD